MRTGSLGIPAHSPNTCDQCGYSGVVHDEYLNGEDASYVCPDCDALTPSVTLHDNTAAGASTMISVVGRKL
jgi:hypothetical protein